MWRRKKMCNPVSQLSFWLIAIEKKRCRSITASLWVVFSFYDQSS